MLISLYRFILRLPQFKGKSRLENFIRSSFLTPPLVPVTRGTKMELDPLEWVQIDLIRQGTIEPLTVGLYEKLLGNGDTYVDIGAHVGFHTLIARGLVGEVGRVIAVDPQPYNCNKILTNWRANGYENLSLYVAAAGDRDGSVNLHDQSPTDKARLSLCLDPVNDLAQRYRVPIMRLDTILGEQAVTNVRLLKIDVEGYEYDVLTGLGRFAPQVDNIVLELLGSTEISLKSKKLLEELKRLGYRTMTVEGAPFFPGDVLPENNLWASRDEGD